MLSFPQARWEQIYHSPQTVFRDAGLQQQWEEKGIVKLPFLSSEEISALQSFYDSLPSAGFKGFHASLFHPEKEYKKKVDAELKARLQKKLNTVFLDNAPLYGNFMVKEAGQGSEMKVHQDWTYVDESRYASVAIWIPLCDTDEKNGCLNFLEGSHRYSVSVRGPGIMCPFEAEAGFISEGLLQPFHMKAGEALVWHHRLVHASGPNLSSFPRVAATLILLPKTAKALHFFHDPAWPEWETEVFASDPDFYCDYKIGQRPQGIPSIGKLEYQPGNLSREILSAEFHPQIEKWKI